MAFPLSWDGATLTWGATGSYLNIYKGGSPTAFMNTGPADDLTGGLFDFALGDGVYTFEFLNGSGGASLGFSQDSFTWSGAPSGSGVVNAGGGPAPPPTGNKSNLILLGIGG